MSNNATSTLLAPIPINISTGMGMNARAFLMAITFAESLIFIAPMMHQTNTMIFNLENYRLSDFLKVGTPPNILLGIIASIFIPILFPF